jgi:hypothetical protein
MVVAGWGEDPVTRRRVNLILDLRPGTLAGFHKTETGPNGWPFHEILEIESRTTKQKIRRNGRKSRSARFLWLEYTMTAD